MTLAPLLAAGPVIQFHVAVVSLTIILTPIQLLLERGSDLHRKVGRVWMIAMALTAVAVLVGRVQIASRQGLQKPHHQPAPDGRQRSFRLVSAELK